MNIATYCRSRKLNWVEENRGFRMASDSLSQNVGCNSSTRFAFFLSKVKRCTIRVSPTPPRFRYFRQREAERAEGESPPKIALVHVFSRDPIRGGLTNRGKPRYSSSWRYRSSFFIRFAFSRYALNCAICEKLLFRRLLYRCTKNYKKVLKTHDYIWWITFNEP